MDIYKIVKGNSFTLHIQMQKAYISQNKQMLEDLDVSEISGLNIFLTDMFGVDIPLFDKPTKDPYVFYKSNGSNIKLSGNEIALTFPSYLEEGIYGITVRGKYNGNDLCSIEKKLFRIVERNGKSHIPLGVVEGEQGGMYNTKYWIELNANSDIGLSYYGASSIKSIDILNLEYLTQIDSLRGRTLHIQTTDEDDTIWFVSPVELTFSQGGLPLEMNANKDDEYYYYHSDELVAGDNEISIL